MYNEAVFAFTQAQQLCPDSPEANFRLAQLYMEVGKFSEAVKTLEDYQQRDPLNRKIGEAINQLKNIQGQSSQIQQLEAMLAGQPRNVGLVVQLAQVRGRIGQMDRVIPLCESFLAQTNLSANDMLQIAQIYLSLNQADRCLATLQRILQQYPQESQAYYAVALIRAAQNMQSESLDALEKAISLAPTLRDVARNDAFPQPGQPGRLVNLRANPRFQRIIGLPPGGVPTQAPAPLFQ
jgi:predicted Zn-dependent protease